MEQGHRPCYDDFVTGIVGKPPGFGKDLKKRDLAVRLIDQRMRDGPNDRDGFALSFPDGNTHFGVSD
jgi:hypothetical protein